MRFSDSDRIQTCNLLIRSQMLYSVELRSQSPFVCDCKVTTKFYNHKENQKKLFFDFNISEIKITPSP